jgi:heme/copper-type cytochrome/quinol oxidase subunit 3
MAIFVFTEVMLFAAFTSSFLIIRNSTPPGIWPPEGQPRLPFERTAFNTALLLVSGVLVMLAHRAFGRRGAAAARLPLTAGLLLGTAFVGLQGVEWVGLIRQGLTLTSSQIGGFFDLIVGCHALHALCALALLALVLAGPAHRDAAAFAVRRGAAVLAVRRHRVADPLAGGLPMMRTARLALALLGLLLPQAAWACAVCGGGNPANRLAFFLSTIALSRDPARAVRGRRAVAARAPQGPARGRVPRSRRRRHGRSDDLAPRLRRGRSAPPCGAEPPRAGPR